MRHFLRKWISRQGHQAAAPISSQLFIGEVTEEGFLIERLVGNHSRKVLWSTLADVKVDLSRKVFSFHTLSGRVFLVPETNHLGWYKLLHQIPHTYPGFDTEAVQEFLAAMEACKVCGGMAVLDNECQACRTQVFDGPRQEAQRYYKNRQREYFSSHAKLVFTELSIPPPDGFAKDPNFEVLVTEAEIDAFQRSH